LLHLVGINSFECMKMHRLTNPKFKKSFLLLFCTAAYMALPFGPCIFAFVWSMVTRKCSSTSQRELSQLKGLLPHWGFCSIVHFGVNFVITSRWNSDNCGHVSICIMNRTCSLRTSMSIKRSQEFFALFCRFSILKK